MASCSMLRKFHIVPSVESNCVVPVSIQYTTALLITNSTSWKRVNLLKGRLQFILSETSGRNAREHFSPRGPGAKELSSTGVVHYQPVRCHPLTYPEESHGTELVAR